MNNPTTRFHWLRSAGGLAFTLLSLWGLCLSSVTAGTPSAPPAKPDKAAQDISLSITDCITGALTRNLDISIDRIAPRLAQAQTLSARGIFDPALQLQLQYGAAIYQLSSTSTQGYSTQTSNYSLGLTQLTPLGTQFSLNVNSSSSQESLGILFAEYSSLANLNVSQPLLRGFGTDITQAQIRIARLGEQVADAAFLSQLEQVVSNVVTAYYELIYAQDNLVSQQTSLDLAQNLLDDNKMRVKIGVMTPLDISQATSEVASRRDAVLQARQSLSEQENALKTLITDDFASMVGQRLVPIDRPVEDLSAKPPFASMGAALKNRPDYREAIKVAEQSKIQLVFSKNQILPQLNLNASYGFGGLGSNLENSFNRVASASYPQWYVGVNVQFPFGNHEARGQRDVAQLQKAQRLLELKKLEQTILVQVNNAANRVKTNQERITVSRTATAYARDALKAEQKKLGAGSTTTYTVLQMQRDVAQAETNELRAIADLHESEVELYRVEGTTLDEYHIALEHSPVKAEVIR
ncbi:MAG: TolC family protein [Chthoniobacteraceae bacterium]